VRSQRQNDAINQYGGDENESDQALLLKKRPLMAPNQVSRRSMLVD